MNLNLNFKKIIMHEKKNKLRIELDFFEKKKDRLFIFVFKTNAIFYKFHFFLNKLILIC